MRRARHWRSGCVASAAAIFLCAAGPDPAPPSQGVDLSAVRYWRLYTGPDGDTETERLAWPGRAMEELGSASGITRFFEARAKSMIVISGKPGWRSPVHDVGRGREVVLVLRGSAIGHFANGRSQLFKAGDITLFEDEGSKGRSVEFGPDGYLAVTVPLAEDQPEAK